MHQGVESHELEGYHQRNDIHFELREYERC